MPEPLILGRYRLGELLGAGGAARVHQAHDELLGVDRAVKILHRRADDQTRARLVREAQLMATLRHPGVLHVYDMGVCEEGDFVVMDLAEGGSLADRMDREGPLSPAMAVAYTLRVLSALQAAHEAGIVHRDVKPQNILLDHEGQALLADFGIARAPQTEDLRTTRTSAGLGSMCFMAPEQRLDARSAGPAADIYAAGCTLYALLCEQTPIDLFTAEPDSERWLAIPPDLRPILVKATRLKPADRFASAADMAGALAQLNRVDAAGSVIGGRPSPLAATREPTQVAPPPRAAGRSRWALGGGLVLLLGLFIIGVQMTDRPTQAPVAKPEPPIQLRDPPPDPKPSVTGIEPTTAPPAVASQPTPPKATPRAPKAPPQDPVGSSAVAGTWSASLNGRPATIRLSGDSASLEGTVTTYLNASDPRGLTVKVAGSYDKAQSVVHLRDRDETPGAGTYTLHLSSDLSTFSGSFDRLDGTYKVPLTGTHDPQ